MEAPLWFYFGGVPNVAKKLVMGQLKWLQEEEERNKERKKNK